MLESTRTSGRSEYLSQYVPSIIHHNTIPFIMCCARGCSSKKCFEKDQVFQRCWMSANRWAPRSEKFSCEYAQRSVQNHRSKHDKARRPCSPTSLKFDRALFMRQISEDARTGRLSFLIQLLSRLKLLRLSFWFAEATLASSEFALDFASP